MLTLPAEGFSLLHYAAKRPNLALVRMLVSRGANINRNAVSDAKERPLQSAVEGGDLAVVDFLVLQGADVHNVNYKARAQSPQFGGIHSACIRIRISSS